VAKILFSHSSNSSVSAILIEAGEPFYVRRMKPDNLGELAEINGGDQVVPRTAIIAVVEDLRPSGRSAFHMRFVRSARADAGQPAFVTVKQWQRARAAMRHAGVKPTRALGGFGYAVAYPDEIAVPDFSVSGSGGWILPRRQIGKNLDALPAIPVDDGSLDPSKSLATFYVAEWFGGSGDFRHRVFASEEEARKATVIDGRWQSGPIAISPEVVEKWRVALTKMGNPIVVEVEKTVAAYRSTTKEEIVLIVRKGGETDVNWPVPGQHYNGLRIPVGVPLTRRCPAEYKEVAKTFHTARSVLLQRYEEWAQKAPAPVNA
jgi:hypothetical protein